MKTRRKSTISGQVRDTGNKEEKTSSFAFSTQIAALPCGSEAAESGLMRPDHDVLFL